jgi:hypothetical protein
MMEPRRKYEHDQQTHGERARTRRIDFAPEEVRDEDKDHRHVDQRNGEGGVATEPSPAEAGPQEAGHQDPVDPEQTREAGPVRDREHDAEDEVEGEEKP